MKKQTIKHTHSGDEARSIVPFRKYKNLVIQITNTIIRRENICNGPLGDRLCGLVVRVLGYRSGGPGSIPGTNRKKSSGSGTGCTQPPEYN
jgi:hypothetical protein